MSEDRGPPSPVMRVTSLWMVMALLFAVGITRLEELAPYPLLFLALALIFGVAPLALFGWALTLRRHKRSRALMVGGTVLLTVLCLVAGSGWLLKTSAKINFQAHREDYDAVVRDIRTRFPRGHGATGVIEGESHGVRFIYDPRRPDRVEFPWTINPVFQQGVIYDAKPCTGDKCPGDVLAPNYEHILKAE